MLFVLVQLDLLGQIIQVSVHTHPHIAALFGIGKNLFVHSLLRPDNRRENQEARSLREGKDAVDDLIGGLLADLPAADRAMRDAHPRVEQSEIVVDFRDRSDRGARVPGGGFLIDGDCRRQPLDGVDIGLVQLTQKHPRIGGQRLDKAPVSLGVDGIKRKRGLSRPGQSGQHNQLVPRDVHIDIFEIMHPHTADGNLLWHSFFILCNLSHSVRKPEKASCGTQLPAREHRGGS